VPDVLVEFPDGRRFAFEIQYAAMTQDEWTWRQTGYLLQGITPIWIFGHLPRYLRRDSYDEDEFVIGHRWRRHVGGMRTPGCRPRRIVPGHSGAAPDTKRSDSVEPGE